MKTIEELIKHYEQELKKYKDSYGTAYVTNIPDIEHRTEAKSILLFIEELKNLNVETVKSSKDCDHEWEIGWYGSSDRCVKCKLVRNGKQS